MLPWRRKPKAEKSKPPALAHVVIVLYSRAGCHLCEDALELLRHRQSQYGFQLEIVDIDTDETLVQRFGNCVPVVTIQGKVRFRGKVAPPLLDRQLRGENQSND